MAFVPLLKWDETGERLYETGTDRGVVYPYSGNQPGQGFAWNGLSAVTESPDGGEATDIYADNQKYLSMRSVENFKGTIEAYMSPPEFDACDGSLAPEGTVGLIAQQQTRVAFAMSYRTRVGNDLKFEDYGYKIHLIYGATVSPSERNYQTINDNPEAAALSWEFETTPVNVPGTNLKPTAHLIIDSTRLKTEKEKACLENLEKILYGTGDTQPRMPMPQEVVTIMTPAA